MEAKKARDDIILYSILLIVAVIFYKWIIPTQIYLNALAKLEKFNPDTFPNFAVTIFIIASAVGLLWAIVRYCLAVKKDGHPKKVKMERTKKETIGLFMPYIVFVLVLVYIILFSKAGFIWATAVIPPVILFVIGCRKGKFYLIYYIFVTAMYLLFRYILLVPIR